MKRIFTLALALVTMLVMQAQNVNVVNSQNMTEEEVQEISLRIKQKVDEFQRYVQDMAEKNNIPHTTKMEERDLALKLFIGKGESYTLTVPTPYGEREQSYPAVTMGIIKSKYNKKYRSHIPMNNYLSDLIKRSENPNYRYKRIVMEAADAVRVDHFSRVGDGVYKAVAHIVQHFAGYNAEGWKVYEDYTSKQIEVIIHRVEINTPDGSLTTYWEILLGNIDCDDIW